MIIVVILTIFMVTKNVGQNFQELTYEFGLIPGDQICCDCIQQYHSKEESEEMISPIQAVILSQSSKSSTDAETTGDRLNETLGW